MWGGTGGALPPLPPGLPPPPMPAFPAPPPGLPPPIVASMSVAPPSFASVLAPPAPTQSALDALFEGIDINVPTAPSMMSDPALEAGDFMIDADLSDEPPPPAAASEPSTEWAASSALGADLLAAFNASSGDEPALAPSETSFADVTGVLTQRLSALAGRLRAEGRIEDADLVTEAMATINLG